MKEAYLDIIERIKQKPLWYDSNGVPRYEKFNVKMCPDIYAEEILLVEIKCQNCDETFLVELHSSNVDWNTSKTGQNYSTFLDKWLDGKQDCCPVHYGDPPRHDYKGDCAAGDTMNCIDLRIVEFWKHTSVMEWERISKYEIELEKDI